MVNDKALVVGVGLMAGAVLAFIVFNGGIQNAAKAAASGAVGAAAGLVGGAAEGVGQIVGLPATNADKARALMDAYGAASWFDQIGMAFQISAYASTADYLKWAVDKTYRPAAGAY